MRPILRILLLTLLVPVILNGCKDDDDPQPVNVTTPTSNHDILVSHYWKLSDYFSAILMDSNGDGILDTMNISGIDSCAGLNKQYFQTNGYSKIVASPGCASSTDSVQWNLSTSGTVLTIDTINYNIFELNMSQLKIATILQFSNPQVLAFDTLLYAYP